MCNKKMDFAAAQDEFTTYLDEAEASILSFCRYATMHEEMCLPAKAMLVLALQDSLTHLSATRVELHAWYDTYTGRGDTPMEALAQREAGRIAQVMMQYGLSLDLNIHS